MIKYIHFYAFRSDLLLLLDRLEAQQAVQYTLADTSDSPDLVTWSAAGSIAQLSVARGEQTSLCDSFLLTMPGTQVVVWPVKLNNGEVRYAVDQMLNSDSIVLAPGGEWKDEMLIAGSFATLSSLPNAQRLMKLLRGLMQKHFTKIKMYWVGPEALLRLRSGFRLTIAEQSSPEYNLREGS